MTPSYLASLNSTKAGFKNKLKSRSLLDPRIKVASRDARRKNALSFIKKGTYTKLAEEMRSKTARALVSKQTLAEALKPEIPADSQAPETPIPDSTSLPPPPHNPVPAMEWWDADFLPAELRDSVKDGSFTGSFDGSEAWSSLRFDLCLTKEFSCFSLHANSQCGRTSRSRGKEPSPRGNRSRGYVHQEGGFGAGVSWVGAEERAPSAARAARRSEAKSDSQRSDSRSGAQGKALSAVMMQLTYRNFKQVLGTEALMHPTEADRKVREQIEQRQLAHQRRNEER